MKKEGRRLRARGGLVLLLILTMGGCVSGPYVRSDIFVDAQAVKSIYLMPTVMEVTIGSDMRLTHQELQLKLDSSYEKIEEFLRAQLAKKGYQVEGYGKKFNDLDMQDSNDRKIKEAIQKFLNPSNWTGKGMEDIIKYFLKHATITTKDDDGNAKIIKEEAQDEEEPVETLATKTLAVKEIFHPDTDTVL